MKRSTVSWALAAALTLTVAGCSTEADTNDGGTVSDPSIAVTDDGEAAPADDAGVEDEDPAEDPAAAADDGSEEGDGEASTVEYGQTYTSPSGISITASKPGPFRLSESGYSPGEFKSFVVLNITIKNGTKKAFDGDSVMLEATSGESPTEEVFDVDKSVGYEGRTILPGRSLTAKVAFGVNQGKPLTLVLSTFDGPLCTFDGTV